jgi:beta-mannosidase
MFGYRGWRKQWGQKRHCGGALVWQLNDCWPVISWSIVDYFQRKKAAYYTMRRVLAPIAVAVKRDHWDWSVVHARTPKKLGWECWAASREATEVRGVVELRFISIASGEEIKPMRRESVAIQPNGTTTVFEGEINMVAEEPHVLAARLWIGKEVAARDCDWPQPLKYLDFADRGVTVTYPSTGTMVVAAKRPTKGLIFEERPGVLIADSAIDVVPGDDQTIKVKGMDTSDMPLDWHYLGME